MWLFRVKDVSHSDTPGATQSFCILSGFMCLWEFDGKGHTPQAVGHIVELRPQTNLMVGVYLAAALFFFF